MIDRNEKFDALLNAIVDGPLYPQILAIAEGRSRLVIKPRLDALGFILRVELIADDETITEVNAIIERAREAGAFEPNHLAYSRAD